MKLLFLSLMGFSVSQPAPASVVTKLVVTNLTAQRAVRSLALSAGQNARVLSFAATQENLFEVAQLIESARVVRQPVQGLTFYGPCIIEISIAAGFSPEGFHSAILTLDVDPSPPQQPPILNIPSNAVVIPADAAGPVTILLESSVDLVTWNSAQPGTYGTSTTNRFFRVRAIR